MAITAKFGSFSKRRNSTKQPTTELSDSRTITLKEGTSIDRPIFKVTGDNFSYNYCEFDNKYYFIDEIISLRNNEIEVHCLMDALATYKSEILASTQYVSYSSQSGGIWLPDTRIPVLTNATVSHLTTTMNFLFNDTGFYVLAAVGENGCEVYGLDAANVSSLINNVNTWKNNDINAIDTLINLPPSGTDETTAINALIAYTENCKRADIRTGFLGNAYLDAPNCVRSCIWVPFFASFFVSGAGGQTIHLGQYDTGVPATKCKTSPESRPVSVGIPWQYNDWRRSVCEEVYLYLPMVGLVNIPSDEIVNETSIDVTWSATASDGCIAYLVRAGNQVIGTYGANCSVNFPIGFSQQASTGEIAQAVLSGAQKTLASGIQTAKSIEKGEVISGVGGTVQTGLTAMSAVYDVQNKMYTRHNSCIGGIGGGAGVGLNLDLTCYTVAHPTVITPSDMKDTMGLPTMKPMSLSGLTGFCQCANAHVEAPATAGELDAIDFYLNSGFFIE